MKSITRKRLFAQIKNDPAFILDEKLFETVCQNLEPQPVSGAPVNPPGEHPRRRRKVLPRVLAGLAGCVLAGALLFTLLPPGGPAFFSPASDHAKLLFPAASNSAPPAHGPLAMPAHGPAMRIYYQYKDGYYKVDYVQSNSSQQAIADFASIQDKIVRNLGSDFVYEIKGYDPAQTIAVFDGRYYYKADFVRKTGFTFNGLSYVLSENETPDNGEMGKQLGQAGAYAIYALADAKPSEKIAVGILDEEVTADSDKKAMNYYIAYQLPASIEFKGTEYYFETDEVREFSPANLTKVGSGDNYDIYASLPDNGTKQITVKLGTKAFTAPAFTPSDQTPPASWYNSPWESMYGINQDIEWNNCDYQLSATFNYMADQEDLKAKVDRKLGDYRYPGDNSHTYGIYTIKGTDPQQAIAVKNNQVYLKYDFAFDEKIEFNGKTYLIHPLDGLDGTRGEKIGVTSNGNEVDSVVGVDPDQEIIVLIGGPSSFGTRLAVRK